MTTTQCGQPTQPGHRRRGARPDLPKARTLLTSVLAAVVGFGTFGMAITPVEVRAADAAPPGGRLIVTWRSGGPGTHGVRSGRTSAPRRTVVVAAPGTAASLAASLRANPEVASVVPDSIVRAADWPQSGAPNDVDFAAYQQDLTLTRVPDAWRITTGTPTTIVAILDSGYTASHPDLASVPLVAPYNEILKTADVTDVRGHGTHVAGTIAAAANNGIGIAGIAPGVSLMPVKVLDDTGSGNFSDVLDGVDYAVAHGASVINLSLGGTLTAAAVAAFQPTFDAAAAAGVLVVAAAGNTGDATLDYPAAFDHVISVGATDNATTNPNGIASFSTRNASVDIAAPGVAILSTLPNGGYESWSGTSMATPHVAAVAALVRSVHPTWTVAKVETDLEETAVDLGAPGRDDLFGYGRIDAGAALSDTSGATYVPLTPARLLDTRSGNGLSGAFSSHVARTFGVAGRGPVPANAVAVTGNLTVTAQTAGGYLFLGPGATNNPTSSTLNFPVRDDRANGVTVALGAGGTLSATYVAATAGPTAQVIFDVTGYFLP